MGGSLKVIILDDATWTLAKKKLEEELHCASVAASLLRAWEKRNGCKYISAAWIRKRHIEAIRLCRRILSQH
jgi:hypothetical protein